MEAVGFACAGACFGLWRRGRGGPEAPATPQAPHFCRECVDGSTAMVSGGRWALDAVDILEHACAPSVNSGVRFCGQGSEQAQKSGGVAAW